MSPQFRLEDYVPVHERIVEFRKEHPDWQLSTKLLVDDGQRVVVKAFVVGETGIVATGHAEEVRGASQVNKTSAIENAETSAVGRALANMGYSITRGLASREEMVKAQRGDWYEQNGWEGGRAQHDAERGVLRDEVAQLPEDVRSEYAELFPVNRAWTKDEYNEAEKWLSSPSS